MVLVVPQLPTTTPQPPAQVSSYLETTRATKFERKQFGRNSIANRSPPVKIGKQQPRRPIRPNSTAARSWSGQSCFRRKTYLMKQFRFVKGSEDNVTKCQFPRIFKLRSGLRPARRARKILGSEQGSFCGQSWHVTALFFVPRYVGDSRLMSVWPQRAYCDNWSFQLLY